MTPQRIYIAGPYSDAPVTNTIKMTDFFNDLVKKGHIPFSPLLAHYANERHKDRFFKAIPYDTWLQYDLDMLRTGHFDMLLFLGESPGSRIELQTAVEIGLSIIRVGHYPDVFGEFANE